MININKLLDNIGVVKSPVSGLETYTKGSVKKLLKEYTELLLKEAVDKAEIKQKGYFESIPEEYLKGIEIYDDNGSDKPSFIAFINKESITSIINDINFD